MEEANDKQEGWQLVKYHIGWVDTSMCSVHVALGMRDKRSLLHYLKMIESDIEDICDVLGLVVQE